MTYFKAVNYFLSIYPMDEVMTETETEMTTSKQPPNMNCVEYVQSLELSALNSGSVYDASVVKGTFIEGLRG